MYVVDPGRAPAAVVDAAGKVVAALTLDRHSRRLIELKGEANTPVPEASEHAVRQVLARQGLLTDG